MTMTQGQLLAATRDQMNATGSTQWSDATLLSWLGLASWREWANLLNANNVYYSQNITVTQDANGQFAISALTTGSGDTQKNFYRILTIAQPTGAAQPQLFYRGTSYREYPNPQPNQQTYLSGLYYRIGTQIQVMPVANGQQMAVQVNYRPPRVDQLSTSSINVDFPDGYEMLLVLDAGVMALQKGGSEAGAASVLKSTAEEIRNQMMMDLGRQDTHPIIAQSMDKPDDWAG